MYASWIHLTTAENINISLSKREVSLPHEAINQYGGGILERRCCVRASMHVYKDALDHDAAIGKVLIYELELKMLQYHSKRANISHRTFSQV